MILFVFILFSALAWFCWTRSVVCLQRSASSKRKAVLEILGRGSDEKKARFVGYFHPYCNLGGGGERVLWGAIQCMQVNDPDVVNIIYTGDLDATKEMIIDKVKKSWDITLNPSTLHFIYLTRRRWVEDKTWPFLTLAGQSLGSMYLACEAMSLLIPDLYMDTMGYAFTYHIVAWLTRTPPTFFPSSSSVRPPIPIIAYTHYPTISHTMLRRVRTRSTSTTNSTFITRSPFLSKCKLIYLRFFSYYYTLSLRRAQVVMVNSSWTKDHVDDVLKAGEEEQPHPPTPLSSMRREEPREIDTVVPSLHISTYSPLGLIRHLLRNSEWDGLRPSASESRIVYPPCDTGAMEGFKLDGRKRIIVSLAQFRPEKDQALQIHALYEFTQRYPEFSDVRLVQIGGARNVDMERVDDLEALVKGLGLQEKVEFIVNAPYSEIIRWLERSSIGISTMVDEHFGINIVEYMAAGLIPVTNRSGGPFLDIAIPVSGKPTGFHCTTITEYAEAFFKVFSMDPVKEVEMRSRGRQWASEAFSRKVFEEGWIDSGTMKWLDIAKEEREKA